MDKQYIGIDLSKAHLDVASYPQTQQWKLANDETGIATLIQYLKEPKPTSTRFASAQTPVAGDD